MTDFEHFQPNQTVGEDKLSTHKKTKAAAFRTSLIVAGILALLTVIEYFVALVNSGAALLLLLALGKAYFVVNNYMHISRLWSSEEGH